MMILILYLWLDVALFPVWPQAHKPPSVFLYTSSISSSVEVTSQQSLHVLQSVLGQTVFPARRPPQDTVFITLQRPCTGTLLHCSLTYGVAGDSINKDVERWALSLFPASEPHSKLCCELHRLISLVVWGQTTEFTRTIGQITPAIR